MTPEESQSLRRWMEDRFDRVEGKIENLMMTATQVVLQTNINTDDISDINAWRADDGPLNARFRRHSERQNQHDGWRNRVVGGIAVLVVLFPTTVGAIVAVLR